MNKTLFWNMKLGTHMGSLDSEDQLQGVALLLREVFFGFFSDNLGFRREIG
jgi:hypothetical protein